jgi:hypothetical protein
MEQTEFAEQAQPAAQEPGTGCINGILKGDGFSRAENGHKTTGFSL